MWRFSPFVIGLSMCVASACQPLPASVSVSIEPNEPMSIDALMATVRVEVDEENGDGLRPSYAFQYEWSRNGEVVEDALNDFVLPDWTVRDDEWAVTVTPIWGSRVGVAVTSEAVLIGNAAPVVNRIDLQPAEPGAHEDVTAVVDATDPDGETPLLTYRWFKNGSEVPELVGDTLSASQTSKDESWEVRVIPVDAYDETLSGNEASASVVIGNGAPVVSSISISVVDNPSKPNVQSGDTLEAEAVVQDQEGDVITVEYIWLVNDIGQSTTSSPTLSSSAISKGDRVRVKATASDPWLEGEPFFSDEIIVANTAPSIQLAQITPGIIKEETTATCEGLGYQDVDGDSAENLYSWFVDDVEQSVTINTLAGDAFDKGQSIRCCVEPSDGTDTGIEKCSETRVVFNSSPSISSTSIQPSNPTKADVLTLDTSTASDPDGDVVTLDVVWYLDGSPVSTDVSIDLSDVNFRKGQKIRATVRPFDGTVLGTEVYASEVTIQNALPTVDVLEISPDPVYTDDVASAKVVVTDLDGDAVTLDYAWTVNSVSAGSGASLDGASAFGKGDVVGLTVTPSDASTGLAVTATAVTVSNSAPDGLVVLIDPIQPIEGLDDLICEVDTAATDVDGDTISYSAVWKKNGVVHSTTTTTTWPSDTVSSAEIEAGQRWTCEMTPSDGVDTGDVSVHEVDIAAPWEMIAGGGQHSCGLDTLGTVTCWGDDTDSQASPSSKVYDYVATGGFHSCGISGGLLYCWGRDTDDQVSDAPASGTYQEVALGLKHSCSMNTSGNLDCWGRDLAGCTSPPSGSYTNLTVGDYHGCALTTTGTASCWGRDVNGESSAPSTTIYGDIAAGSAHTCGIIKATGGLDCWGSNSKGATSAPATTGYSQISCGKHHCCAISSSGGIDCWGDDTWNQSTPPTSGVWESVSAGRYHTCAWTAAGYGECWGQNSFLQTTIP